jgi:hypothetical protein
MANSPQYRRLAAIWIRKAASASRAALRNPGEWRRQDRTSGCPDRPPYRSPGSMSARPIGAAREAQKRSWQTPAPIHRDPERRISRVAL